MFGFNKKTTYTDHDLIDLYKSSGDMVYVGELFTRYTRLIASVAINYLKNKEDTEDVVMEVFEIIVHDLKTTDIKNFKPWLYSVTKHHSLKRLRINQKQPQLSIDSENNYDFFMEFTNKDSQSNNKEEIELKLYLLETVLSGLKEEQKICIELMYFEHHSYQEITEITGYSLNQVKSFIQNGKRKLKILMENQ